MKIANNITELVGSTPLVRLEKINRELGAEITAKLEFFNPCASVKDRVGLALIQDAEQRGIINKKTLVVEATSGNTGIGLAFVCAQRGYKLVLVMPGDVSCERRKLLSLFGAKVVLTAKEKGMNGALARARKIVKQAPNSFMPGQFENLANPAAHSKTTAQEILHDAGAGFDVFVAGAGSGGTITGVGRTLKQQNPKLKIVAVEPAKSAVLSGKKAGAHKIAGIGAGFIPKVLDREIIDEVVTVSDAQAVKFMKRLMKEEGIAAGISSGAALAAAVKIAGRKELSAAKILVIFPDSVERYLSVL